MWVAGLGMALLVSHDAKAGPPSVPFRQSHHGEASQLNFLFGDLPDGVSYNYGIGADESTAPISNPVPYTWARALYGTSQDPSAPLLELSEGALVAAAGFDELDTFEAQDRHAFTVHGRRAECGRIDLFATLHLGPTQVWCYVETANELVYARGLRLDMTTMVSMMHGLTLDAQEPRIESSVLPSGMTLLRHESSPDSPQWATSGVAMSGTCYGSAGLTVGWADEFEMADIGWRFDDWTNVDVNGHRGVLGFNPGNSQHLIVWTADGRAFALEVSGKFDALTLARSVRAATPTEWATMGKQLNRQSPAAC